jgi:tetratricopeptide (TPR) repeat protein
VAPSDLLNLNDTLPLPECLSALANNRSSGVLSAHSGDITREILIVDGEVRAARSDLEEEKFGMWLVQRQRISEDDRALTLLSQGGSDAPPLGHLLATRGALAQDVLEAELEQLALTIIRQASAAAHTRCEFREGLADGQPDTLPNLTTPQIILEAARAFDDPEAKQQAIGSMDQVAWPSSALDTLLNELDLTPSEAFVLSRLDGSRKLSSLVAISSLSPGEALSTVYALKAAGVVNVGSSPLPTPMPAMTSATPQRTGGSPDLPIVDESTLSPSALAERENVRKLAEMATRIDHYRALGLRGGAGEDAIDSAWASIKQRYSPERASNEHLRDMRPQLGTIVDRANEAYEVLSDRSSRQRYDAILESLDNEQNRRGSDQIAREQLVEANFQRAAGLLKEGEVFLAIRLLEQACALDPRPPELLKLARLLMRNPLWTGRALATIRKAIEADPSYADAWVELAEFWRRRSSPERQRKALERALAANPEDTRAGQMYERLVGRKELYRLLKAAQQHKGIRKRRR